MTTIFVFNFFTPRILKLVVLLAFLPVAAYCHQDQRMFSTSYSDTTFPVSVKVSVRSVGNSGSNISFINGWKWRLSIQDPLQFAMQQGWHAPLILPITYGDSLTSYFKFKKNSIPTFVGDYTSTSSSFPKQDDAVSPFLLQATAAVQTDLSIVKFNAKLKTYGEGISLKLLDTVLLNQRSWTVNGNNQIYLSPAGFRADNIRLAADSSLITINSRQRMLNSPVDIAVKQIQLRDIMPLFSKKPGPLNGDLAANFTVADLYRRKPTATGSIAINRLQVYGLVVGNAALTIENGSDEALVLNGRFKGFENDIDLRGTMDQKNTSRMLDARLDVNKLSLLTVQAFANGLIADASGTIKGQVAINGPLKNTNWNGYLKFDSAAFKLATLGTKYRIHQQQLQLQNSVVHLRDFTIADSAGNLLQAHGTITRQNGQPWDLDVNVRSTNFNLLNVSKSVANQLYGRVYANSLVNIGGTSRHPKLSGKINFVDNSVITLVLPQTNVNRDASGSVVRFIDRDQVTLPEPMLLTPKPEALVSLEQFYNHELQVNIDNRTVVNLVIDPAAGDALQVQGKATLNAGVDTSGQLLLSGKYVLDSGFYVLNYQFLRKQFFLLPGSDIVFNGTPEDATVNIAARYVANSSPRDLIGNEIGEINPALEASFNKNIPFNVILHLKGPLKKPTISFDIQLPPSSQGLSSELRTTIQNKLSQLAEDASGINRQVFSLLLLNRFVGEQSTDFFKGNGDGLNNLSKESVSRFLTSALDNIAADLFKGLDMEMNLNTYRDYSIGDAQQKAASNMAVTKSFIDNRLTITVGKSFGIEGQDANAKAALQKGVAFLPDVTSTLQLTADGKYLLRSYKKSPFELVIDGYVTESGLGFIIRFDYESFKHLTRRSASNSVGP